MAKAWVVTHLALLRLVPRSIHSVIKYEWKLSFECVYRSTCHNTLQFILILCPQYFNYFSVIMSLSLSSALRQHYHVNGAPNILAKRKNRRPQKAVKELAKNYNWKWSESNKFCNWEERLMGMTWRNVFSLFYACYRRNLNWKVGM
jgi:hypothetical protein